MCRASPYEIRRPLMNVPSVVDVVNGRRVNFVLKLLDVFGRSLGVRAPLDPELEEVRGDASALGVRSDALVNESLHALDEFGGGEAGLRVGLAPELAVNDR